MLTPLSTFTTPPPLSPVARMSSKNTFLFSSKNHLPQRTYEKQQIKYFFFMQGLYFISQRGPTPNLHHPLKVTRNSYKQVWGEIEKRLKELNKTDTHLELRIEISISSEKCIAYLLGKFLSSPFIGLPQLMLDFDANPKRQTEVKDLSLGMTIYFLLLLRFFQKESEKEQNEVPKTTTQTAIWIEEFKAKVEELATLHKERGYFFTGTEVREKLGLQTQINQHGFCSGKLIEAHVLKEAQLIFQEAVKSLWQWLRSLQSQSASQLRLAQLCLIQRKTLCTALEHLCRWYAYLLKRQRVLQTTHCMGVVLSSKVQELFWESTASELDLSWSETIQSMFSDAVYASELLPGSKMYFRTIYGNTSLRLHQAVVSQKTLPKAEFMALQQIGRTKALQEMWLWNHRDLNMQTAPVVGHHKKDAQDLQMQEIHFKKIKCSDLLDIALINQSFMDHLDRSAIPAIFRLPFYEMSQHTLSGTAKSLSKYSYYIVRVPGGWMVLPSSDNISKLPPVLETKQENTNVFNPKLEKSIFTIKLVEAFVVWAALTQVSDPSLFLQLKDVIGLASISKCLPAVLKTVEGNMDVQR